MTHSRYTNTCRVSRTWLAFFSLQFFMTNIWEHLKKILIVQNYITFIKSGIIKNKNSNNCDEELKMKLKWQTKLFDLVQLICTKMKILYRERRRVIIKDLNFLCIVFSTYPFCTNALALIFNWLYKRTISNLLYRWVYIWLVAPSSKKDLCNFGSRSV